MYRDWLVEKGTLKGRQMYDKKRACNMQLTRDNECPDETVYEMVYGKKPIQKQTR